MLRYRGISVHLYRGISVHRYEISVHRYKILVHRYGIIGASIRNISASLVFRDIRIIGSWSIGKARWNERWSPRGAMAVHRRVELLGK